MASDRFSGRRVILTRPPDRASGLATRLHKAGATVLAIPMIRIGPPADSAPLEAALLQWNHYHWTVFTSPAAVESVAQRRTDWPPAPRLAAIGPRTAEALKRLARAPDLEAQTASASGLLAEPEISGDLSGLRFLLPVSNRARSELGDGLQDRGATVTSVVAYRTEPRERLEDEVIDELLQHDAHAIVFASPSAVEAWSALAVSHGLDAMLNSARAISIGPTTSAALRARGLTPSAEAALPGDDGLWQALCEALPLVDPSS